MIILVDRLIIYAYKVIKKQINLQEQARRAIIETGQAQKQCLFAFAP